MKSIKAHSARCRMASHFYQKYGVRILALLLTAVFVLTACAKPNGSLDSGEPPTPASEQDRTDDPSASTNDPSDKEKRGDIADTAPAFSLFSPEGETLEARIHPPAGYVRISSDETELTTFLRNFPLKKDGSKVLLYNGKELRNQKNHAAIFDLPLENRDLQQCADSIMRIYAEYYWSQEEYDRIAFHLTNGFLMEYTKWRDGNRLQVDGNDVRWAKTQEADDSYDNFHRYLSMLFAYAGTLSLAEESEAIEVKDIRPGDMFLQGGSPGHCVLIIDIAEDANGSRCFLLAQGYMPAQDFHVLKNPLHPEDPWYYASEITFPLATPSWTFREGSLMRWGEFPLNASESSLVFPASLNSGKSSSTLSVMSFDGKVEKSKNQRQNEETSEENQVTLLAVGDNLIHREVIKSGRKKDGTYNYDHLYANVKDEISAADIAIINQETILGGSDFAYSGYPSFNSPTEIGDAVANAGFDVVLHATNHTMDKGLQGVLNTLAFWKQYPEITILGINETSEQREEIKFVEKNGIKLAMLNYTYGLNGYHVPKNKPYLVNLIDLKQMAEDIDKAKKIADFTIVFPHWGTEYVYEPTKTQKELCEFFYEHGVDLVIGTHPHVLEPVEWMETEENHRMLIYYSLGNFVSYQREAPRMLGGMAHITITKNADGTLIKDADITPLVTHYEKGAPDYHYAIYKLSEYTPQLAAKHGVSDHAKDGPLTYWGICSLAKQILGSWY